MDAMMELHASGKYAADNGFKPGYPQAIQDLTDVGLPNSGLQADPHIKSRLKTLKGNFGVMHDMVLGSSPSGFDWDPEKCVVTAPNDVWDAYVKTRPKAAGLKDKRSFIITRFQPSLVKTELWGLKLRILAKKKLQVKRMRLRQIMLKTKILIWVLIRL